MHPGVNLEFARSASSSFDESLEAARRAGYEYVELSVCSAVALRINSHLSLKRGSGYHHLGAGTADAREIPAERIAR